MDIECPEDAVAVWIRADELFIRFPDRQLIKMPATQIAGLNSILRARENRALKVASGGAPTQWQVDRTPYEIGLSDRIHVSVEARLSREKKRADKQAERIRAKVEAEKLLEELGL